MKNVCVYCGSSDGRLPVYSEVAENLATALVDGGMSLIYGGASVGLMGTLADRVLDLGGKVIGVMPESLVQKEVAHNGLTELRVTRDMHERKTVMAELADGFIAMPGGIGTLEELFEIWTWGQLGFHQKPFGLLNIEGYFDLLLAFLDRSVTDQFVKPEHLSMLFADDSPSVLLNRFKNYDALQVTKWNP